MGLYSGSNLSLLLQRHRQWALDDLQTPRNPQCSHFVQTGTAPHHQLWIHSELVLWICIQTKILYTHV